jgi:hypothetical protein
MLKVDKRPPLFIRTLEGNEAMLLLLESVTSTPPEGAGALRITSPVRFVPPTTVEGFRLN